MDALLSDKESWYYMKLLTFTLGIGMEVLHQYFEQKILQSMDFYVFVEKYKHYLFHECFPTVQCCECSQMQLHAQSKRGCLNEIQFQLLFEIAPPSKLDHYKTGRNNTIVKDCLCRIDAKRSNEVDCMDITLMCAIIKSCLINNNTSIYGNPRFLETIKETRNFLAHSTDLRITKSEFDTRWAKTEHAVIEIASVVGNYFLKLQKRKIDAFKDNELSMENIKTIIDNNADEVKKNLQTLVADQRKNTILIKDEIIENLTKYKDYLDELSIDIGSLKFEVKQYALAVVASCSAKETFDSQVHQKDAATRSSEVSVTEKDKDNRRCRVEWRLETPSTWNLPEIKETLEKFSALLRQWFEIEFVYVGSLVIKTLVQKNVLDNQEQMRKSIHSFLEKIVDVCKIKTDVSTVIKVALIIDPGESDYKEEAEEQTSKIERNKKDKTTCIFCNKSFDCQNCLQKAKIISRLKDELSENRKESSAISLESVVSEMDEDSSETKSSKSVKTVEQLKKVAKKFSSGSNRKAMTLTTVQSLSSIESFLLPAPICVAILGQLMAIATTIDFSLTKNAPTGGFQYLKHPDSFRACLVQISISGCDAFTTAHKNMDKLRLHCMTFRECVNMMLKGNEQDKSSLAPIILKDMMQQANRCLEATQNTESDFNALTALLSEVCCAATEAKGLHESNLIEAMNRRKILKNRKKLFKVQKLEIEKEKREIIEQLSKAKQELEEAEGDIPGPMKTILMKTFEKVVNFASTSAYLFGLSELANPFAMTTVVVKDVYDLGIAAIANSGKEETKGDTKTAMKIALKNAPEIYSLVSNLVENIESHICQEIKTEKKNNSDKQNLQDDNQSKWQNDISCIREQFEKIMKELEDSDVLESAAVQATSHLCKRSITVCVTLTQRKGCKDVFEGLLKEVKSISKEAESLKIKSDMFFSPGATTCLDMPIDSSNENEVMVEQVIDNLLIKIERRKQRLEYLRRKQEAVIQNAQEIIPQNTKLLEEFLKTDLQKIEFEEIIETLAKGMEAFDNLNKEWRTLVLYFLHITSRIEACMLDKTTHLEKRLPATDISFRAMDYKNKSILEIAAGMDAVAYSVELLAKTYTDISGKHLVSPTAGLIGMITLNPKKDVNKLNDKRRELNENCIKAQQEITKLTAEIRERAFKHIHEQFDRIKIIESEIPGVEEDRKDQIRKTVAESIEYISNIEMDESGYL